MKIALISRYYPLPWNGVGIHVYYLSRELSKLGHEVHVVTTKQVHSPNEKMDNTVYIHRVPEIRAPVISHLSSGWNALQKLRELDNDFDVIHTHHGVFQGKEGFKRIQTPLITTMHGTVSGEWHALKVSDLSYKSKGDATIFLFYPLFRRYEKLYAIHAINSGFPAKRLVVEGGIGI